MKYKLEEASLLYLGKLLSDDDIYTEQLEDAYVNLKCAIEERNKFEEENTNLKQSLNEIRKYIHSEEFFLLMNSGSQDDPNKPCCEDYFKAQGKLDKIIDKVLGGKYGN